MLFIKVLEALSQEFRTGCPLKNLYADDLISEFVGKLQEKLILWNFDGRKGTSGQRGQNQGPDIRAGN